MSSACLKIAILWTCFFFWDSVFNKVEKKANWYSRINKFCCCCCHFSYICVPCLAGQFALTLKIGWFNTIRRFIYTDIICRQHLFKWFVLFLKSICVHRVHFYWSTSCYMMTTTTTATKNEHTIQQLKFVFFFFWFRKFCFSCLSNYLTLLWFAMKTRFRWFRMFFLFISVMMMVVCVSLRFHVRPLIFFFFFVKFSGKS